MMGEKNQSITNTDPRIFLFLHCLEENEATLLMGRRLAFTSVQRTSAEISLLLNKFYHSDDSALNGTRRTSLVPG